jgi:hypothetical protein
MEKIKDIIKVHDETYLGYKVITDNLEISIFINNSSTCCESWGIITTEDDIKYYIGAEFLNVEAIDMDYKNHIFNNLPELHEGDYCFVNLTTTEGVLQFAFYNIHNGYYGHNVIIKINNLIDNNVINIFSKYI